MGKKTGIAGSFKTRYGTKPRKKYIAIVSQLKQAYECPKCARKSVKRVSFGVWKCRKCGYMFAGGAYTPFTKIGVIAERSSMKKIGVKTGFINSPETKVNTEVKK